MGEPISLHSISELREIPVREGVVLRPLKIKDATGLLKVLDNDSSIRNKVTVASRMHTPEEVAAEIAFYKNDKGLIRYTLLKDDTPIGLVSLWRDDGFFGTPPHPDDYGFGYFLDPEERGKGLITNAVESLMEIVTKNLPVNQFVAFCEDNNRESLAVLTKLGFKPTDETFSEPTNGWIERKYSKPVKR